MIDFQNGSFVKLKPADPQATASQLQPLLLPNEQILCAFQGIRDSVTFTNMRIIAVNVQGMTGKKKDFTSLPYSKIQAFSVESAGVFDLDSELELYFSGLGLVKFEFAGSANVTSICQMISGYVLR